MASAVDLGVQFIHGLDPWPAEQDCLAESCREVGSISGRATAHTGQSGTWSSDGVRARFDTAEGLVAAS